jgi:hypothetical protein
MKGPANRLIRSQGVEYTVRNADGGGGRDTPDYSDDGTVVGVLEQRGMPRTATDSSGTDVESDLEIRVIPDDSVLIREAGSADGYPTKLVHPQGQIYRVLATTPEDSGVTVLMVVRD